jgi:hypothetical protein
MPSHCCDGGSSLPAERTHGEVLAFFTRLSWFERKCAGKDREIRRLYFPWDDPAHVTA